MRKNKFLKFFEGRKTPIIIITLHLVELSWIESWSILYGKFNSNLIPDSLSSDCLHFWSSPSELDIGSWCQSPYLHKLFQAGSLNQPILLHKFLISKWPNDGGKMWLIRALSKWTHCSSKFWQEFTHCEDTIHSISE